MIIQLSDATFPTDSVDVQLDPADILGYESTALAHYILDSSSRALMNRASASYTLAVHGATPNIAASGHTVGGHFNAGTHKGYSTGINAAADMTVVCVGKMTSGSGLTQIFATGTGTSDGFFGSLEYSTPNKARIYASSVSATPTATITDLNVFMSGVSASLVRKGVGTASGITPVDTAGSYTIAASKPIYIGPNEMTGSTNYDDFGQVAEMIIFARLLTAAEMSALLLRIQTRLAQRGLSLAA